MEPKNEPPKKVSTEEGQSHSPIARRTQEITRSKDGRKPENHPSLSFLIGLIRQLGTLLGKRALFFQQELMLRPTPRLQLFLFPLLDFFLM